MKRNEGKVKEEKVCDWCHNEAVPEYLGLVANFCSKQCANEFLMSEGIKYRVGERNEK